MKATPYIELENPTPQQRQFLLQKFEPSCITEYFEGWEFMKDTVSLKTVLDLNLEILDDFIDECNRNSPFNLTWKPEIVNKYFK